MLVRRGQPAHGILGAALASELLDMRSGCALPWHQRKSLMNVVILFSHLTLTFMCGAVCLHMVYHLRV